MADRSTIQSLSGAVLSLTASLPDSYDQYGYTAENLGFTAVGEVESFGKYGATANVSTFTATSNAVTTKIKGARDYGTMNVMLGNLPVDAGQDVVEAAIESTNRYSMRVTYPLARGGIECDVHYLDVLVSKREWIDGAADDVRKIAVDFSICRKPTVASLCPLFLDSEQGVWYDPSDFAAMYQDSIGTTAVTAVEQPVGLALDKRLSLVRGPERFTGSATTSSALNANGTATNNGDGTYTCTCTVAGTYGVSFSNLAAVVGSNYELTADVTANSASRLVSSDFGGKTVNVGSAVADDRHGVFVSATSTGVLTFYITGALVGESFTLRPTSIKDLPGNHAIQATAASRPTLSARYNLLTKTEQFDDAGWAKLNATVTANTDTDPLGGSTADRMTDTAINDTHQISLIPTLSDSVEYKLSVYAKAGTISFMRLAPTTKAGVTNSTYFNLATGAVGSVGSGHTAAISAVGNGWYRCSITYNAGSGATSTTVRIAMTNANGASTYLGDGTGTILLWGADLRTSADASLRIPSYQRVNTATDYDTTDFPHYLKFDGVDDSLATASVDFTGTDEMTVIAGAAKLSDAAIGIVVELSADLNSNNGGFYIAAPISAGSANLNFASKGTVAAGSNWTNASAAAPLIGVITGIAEIPSDKNLLRFNGAQVGSTVSNQGTGNYGNHPLYLGRRGGSTLPFNGRLYGLFVRGAETDDATIKQFERHLADEMGVALS